MYDLRLLPQNLKKYREIAGLTQARFSENIGYSSQYYSVVESGAKPPSVEFLRAAANALEVPIACLLSDAEPFCITDKETHEFLKDLSENDLQTLNRILEALCFEAKE